MDSLFDAFNFGGNFVKYSRCLCGKLTAVGSHESGRKYSGIVNYTSELCSSCEDTYKSAARIVCVKCKRLQGFMPAQQTKEGFRFEEGKCYHIDGCPQCVNGLYSTPVLEYASFLRKKGIAVKQDLDLLQEIETKRLQVGAEAARMTAEVVKPFKPT